MSTASNRLFRGVSLAALGFTMVVGTAGMAQADASKGWYLGALGGLNFTETGDLTDTTTGITGEMSHDRGWGAGLLAGYDFGPFRLQADAIYRRNSFDKFKLNGVETDASGHVSSIAPMVSALYDINTGTRFTPYIGAGVGAARVKLSTNGTDSNKWKFAYQGIAGVNYDFNPNWAMGVEYRYFATSKVKTAGLEYEYTNHSVFLGLTYKFAAPAPVPVAEVAPPPPPPPAPPAPELARSYLVFFDWNSSTVTPEAASIITEASNAAKQLAVTRIELTGHADRSGSPAYNQKLSEKRGEAVKNSLVQLGVPAEQITVVGKGETSPLVPTADGVREPQNRRVEIVLP